MMDQDEKRQAQKNTLHCGLVLLPIGSLPYLVSLTAPLPVDLSFIRNHLPDVLWSVSALLLTLWLFEFTFIRFEMVAIPVVISLTPFWEILQMWEGSFGTFDILDVTLSSVTCVALLFCHRNRIKVER